MFQKNLGELSEFGPTLEFYSSKKIVDLKILKMNLRILA